jgi:hypothetical protein
MEEKKQLSENQNGLKIGIIRSENGYDLMHPNPNSPSGYEIPILERPLNKKPMKSFFSKKNLKNISMVLGLCLLFVFLFVPYFMDLWVSKMEHYQNYDHLKSMSNLENEMRKGMIKLGHSFPKGELFPNLEWYDSRKHLNNPNRRDLDKERLRELVRLEKLPKTLEDTPIPHKLTFDPVVLDVDMYSLFSISVLYGTTGTLRLKPSPNPSSNSISMEMTVLSKSKRQLERVTVEKKLMFDLFKGTIEMDFQVHGPTRDLMEEGPVEIQMDVYVPTKKRVQGLKFYGEALDILVEESKILLFDDLSLITGNGKIMALSESLLLTKNVNLYSTNGDIDLFGLAYRDTAMVETEQGSITVPSLFPHRVQMNDLPPWKLFLKTLHGTINVTTAQISNVQFRLRSNQGEATLSLTDQDQQKVKLKKDEKSLKAGVYGMNLQNEGEIIEGIMDIQAEVGNVEWKVDESVKVVNAPF